MPDSTRQRSTGASFYGVVLTAACAGLVVLVVLLARQNARLKAELGAMAESGARGRTSTAPPLAVGHRLVAVTGVDAAGVVSVIALDAPGRRLVMIGSVHCGACQSVRPFWHEAGQWAAAAKIEAVCLMTDDRPPATDAQTLGVPVHQVRDFEASSIAGLPLVPAMLVVRDGVVERMWLGEMGEAQREEVRGAVYGG